MSETDKAIRRLYKRIEELEGALKVISIWATFEKGYALDPVHVAKLCDKVLKK